MEFRGFINGIRVKIIIAFKIVIGIIIFVGVL
jgi:hypothetical protein